MEAERGHLTHTPPAPHTRGTAHSGKKPDTPTQGPKGTPTAAPRRLAQPGLTGKEQPEDREHSNRWTLNRTTHHHNTLTTATEPRTEPQTPHRVGVPRATTTRSTAPKTRTTATHLNTRRNTTTTGTTPQGRNRKRRPRPWRQRSHARQRTTHTKHHYPCQVEHTTPRWKPTPQYPPLRKPLSCTRNHCLVASTSPRTTAPWT